MTDKIKEFMNSKMKDMEIVSEIRRGGSSDNLGVVRRSTLQLPQLKKKYSQDNSTEKKDDSIKEKSSNEVSIEVVKPKRENQDSDLGNDKRTLIFRNGKLLGSQG